MLRDARLSLLDEAHFAGGIGAGASWERRGSGFVLTTASTPGAFAPAAGAPAVPAHPPRPALTDTAPPSATASAPPPAATVPVAPAVNTAATAGAGAAVTDRMFLAASVVLGLAVAAAFIAVKRALP
jgi:hypothetical protein